MNLCRAKVELSAETNLIKKFDSNVVASEFNVLIILRNLLLLHGNRYGPVFLQSDWLIAGPYLLFTNWVQGPYQEIQAQGFSYSPSLRGLFGKPRACISCYCLTKISIRAKRSISRVFSLFIVPSPFFVHCPDKGRINRAESVLTGLKPY